MKENAMLILILVCVLFTVLFVMNIPKIVKSGCIQRGFELNRPAEEIERICDYERKG